MLKTLSRFLSLGLVLALAACGGSKEPAPVAPTTTTAPATGTVTLELGELKLVDINKDKAITIHADGTIEYEGQGGVKVTTDGKIVKSDTGEVGFQLLPDGSITGPDGKIVDISLSEDAVITSGDKKISVDDTGALVGANPDAPPMRIEGATTPGLKRTALFVLIALTTPDEMPAPDDQATPTAPPS